MNLRTEEETESVEHGIVNLISRYVPDASDKLRYQCADVVKDIIEFESSVEWSINNILKAIDDAKESGFISEALSHLKECTEIYSQSLTKLKNDAGETQRELACRVLKGHRLNFDETCEFEVSGYRFSAIPQSKDVNYIISDLFSHSDIANINMRLSNAVVTGDKKIRKTQLPTRLIMNLWFNDHERE